MKEKILLVGRNENLISKIYQCLESNYEIHQAKEYASAIEKYYEFQPDIIIAEDIIDGSGGIAFCDYIKGQSNNIKILLLLHEDIIDNTYARIKSGADLVIPYPKNETEINDLLNLPFFYNANYKYEETFQKSELVSDNLEIKYPSEEIAFFSSMGEYKIISKIAEGGMADVYLAMKQGISGFRKLLVIKLINRIFSRLDDFINRFIDEAKICAYLNHKNIVQIYDHGRYKQRLFIAMEYVDGINLASLRQKITGSIIPPEHVLYIAQELCYGLSYAYNACDDKGRKLRIIHRDLSPQNILLSRNGEVKIADFGVAKSSICHHQPDKKSIVGKIYYMSPEQIQGNTLHLSDLFSLGIIMYEMITNEHPYLKDKKINSPLEIINEILHNEYRPIRNNSEKIKLLERIIIKALVKQKELRYQTADDMLSDLLTLSWGSTQKDFQEFLYPYLKK